MDLGLKGKSAAISGGSQGLGNAIANALADEGCNVAISARGEERLNQAVEELSAKGVKAVGIDQVLDIGRIDAGPLHQAADNLGGHLVGTHLGERALGREMERRACVAGDVYILMHGQQIPRRGGEGTLRFRHAREWTGNG